MLTFQITNKYRHYDSFDFTKQLFICTATRKLPTILLISNASLLARMKLKSWDVQEKAEICQGH